MAEILSLIEQDIRVRRSSSSKTGRTGEDLAARYLVERGYRLVLANFKVPVGRNSRGVQVTGEIDLVALDKDVLCFIEVKTKRSDTFAGPLSAVDLRKQRQITRTARVYRDSFGIRDIQYRFDVVTVVLEANRQAKLELIRGFWSETKFRKKAWTENPSAHFF